MVARIVTLALAVMLLLGSAVQVRAHAAPASVEPIAAMLELPDATPAAASEPRALPPTPARVEVAHPTPRFTSR